MYFIDKKIYKRNSLLHWFDERCIRLEIWKSLRSMRYLKKPYVCFQLYSEKGTRLLHKNMDFFIKQYQVNHTSQNRSHPKSIHHIFNKKKIKWCVDYAKLSWSEYPHESKSKTTDSLRVIWETFLLFYFLVLSSTDFRFVNFKRYDD